MAVQLIRMERRWVYDQATGAPSSEPVDVPVILGTYNTEDEALLQAAHDAHVVGVSSTAYVDGKPVSAARHAAARRAYAQLWGDPQDEHPPASRSDSASHISEIRKALR